METCIENNTFSMLSTVKFFQYIFYIHMNKTIWFLLFLSKWKQPDIFWGGKKRFSDLRISGHRLWMSMDWQMAAFEYQWLIAIFPWADSKKRISSFIMRYLYIYDIKRKKMPAKDSTDMDGVHEQFSFIAPRQNLKHQPIHPVMWYLKCIIT